MNEYLNESKATNPVFQLISLLFVVFGFMILGDTIALGLISLIYNYKITGVDSLYLLFGKGDRLQSALLAIQTLKASLAFIIFPVLYIFFFKKYLKNIFKLDTNLIPHFILAGIMLFFITMPLLGLLVEWNKNIQLPAAWKHLEIWMQESEKQNGELTNLLIYFDNKREMIAILFVVAILPAIGEELLFRGILQNELVRILRNPHLGIVLASILFSALHFQFYGFFPRMGLGILFGYLYYWSGTILVPILMHFTNNALTFFVMNTYAKEAAELEKSKAILPFATAFSIFFMVLIIIQCIKLYKRRILMHE